MRFWQTMILVVVGILALAGPARAGWVQENADGGRLRFKCASLQRRGFCYSVGVL